jgi:RIO kinase 1
MLYSGGQLRIIDLPQAVDARTNGHARSLLVRDVANVCDYFAGQVGHAMPGTFVEELWDRYLRAEL